MKLPVIIALVAVAAATELSPVDDARVKFYAFEQDLWRNVTNIDWSNGMDGQTGYYKFAKAFLTWAEQIQSISTLPSSQLSSWLWNKAWEHMHQINNLYEMFAGNMRSLLSGSAEMPSYETVPTGKNFTTNPIRQLEELLEHGDKLLYDLAEENENEDCTKSVFRAKLIYDMYSTVALAELKGYAVTQLTWMLLRLEGKGNFSQEITQSRERYALRAAQAAEEARRAMSAARREIHMCDPSVHVEGFTYEQVTRLLQGYVENEVDMNESGTCGDNCPSYTRTSRYDCYMDQFCAHQKTCYGTIRECRFVESHMTVCTSSRSSNRRYEWIQYDSGRKLGDVSSCPRETNRVYSWYRGFYHCSYCLCLCDDDTYSHRYFSVREATSDVHTNKVVTGIRIVKHDRMFHLQVHEGSLKPRGTVEPVGWVPVDKFDPSDIGVYVGWDYHKLSYESRAIDLNKMNAQQGRLLTGVRFRLVSNDHLHLSIRTKPFNYTTGQLIPNRTRWEVSSTSSHKLDLQSPDLPTRSPSKLHVDSSDDQYVEFTHSDFDADAAQSTVPFIDVQPVLPSKGAALATGAGGVLALRLFMYPYHDHVHATGPHQHFQEYEEIIESDIDDEELVLNDVF